MENTKDNVPYHLHIMVEIIGYENFLEICKMYGGTAVYIPVYKKVTQSDRNKKLKQEFNGANFEELRHKYNLSREHVRRIVESEDI